MNGFFKQKQYFGLVLIMGAVLLIFPNSGIGQGIAIREAIITHLKGEAQVRVNDGSWRQAVRGMKLYERNEIIVFKNSKVQLLIDEGGRTGKLELDECSRMRFYNLSYPDGEDSAQTKLELAIGRVMVYVNKLSKKSKFEVHTPNASAGVRGTEFEVSVDKKDAARDLAFTIPGCNL